MNWDRFDSAERELLERLDRDARLLADHFRLPLAHLTKESDRVKRRYGSCDSEGVVRIRLRNRRNGEFLKYSSLVATLCHELAHLHHLNHGKRFRVLYMRILEYARANAIYRPRAVAPRGETSERHAALNPRRRRRKPASPPPRPR